MTGYDTGRGAWSSLPEARTDVQRPGVPFNTKVRRLLALFVLFAFAVVFAVSAFYEGPRHKAELSGVMKGLAATSGSPLRESIMRHHRNIGEVIAALPEGSDAAVLAKPYSVEGLSRVLHELFQGGGGAAA